MAAAPHTVVVIGASFGGLPIAHALLKDVFPTAGKPCKLVLINPSEEFYWKIGSPRSITRPDKLPMDKVLLNFLPTFSKYGAQFEFIKGKASQIDPATRTVSTDTGASVHYDQLVIASGTYFDNDLWSTARGTDALRNEVNSLHAALPNAQTVVVGGGGPAGVETAGELGEAYGGKKEIIIYSGAESLLSRLQNKKTGASSQAMLEKMGVKVIHNVLIKDVQKQGHQTVLTLSNGETKTVDVYIGATGDKPNSSYVPKAWLNERGKVLTDPNTLRVTAEGAQGVYCCGSVGSYSDGSILDTKLAYTAAVESVKLDMAGTSKLNPIPTGHRERSH